MKKFDLVLIVDDDVISNYITTTTIQYLYEDVNIKTALNGTEAMKYLTENPNDIPDIIFLDINMPIMNGFEFLDWYQNSPINGTIRICMLTTSVRMEDKEKAGIYTDVIGYIEKPLQHESIKSLLENL